MHDLRGYFQFTSVISHSFIQLSSFLEYGNVGY